MSWYECPKCGRELNEDQAVNARCKRCGDVVVRVRGKVCPVNLNTATKLELIRIAGFGEKAASNVVAARTRGRKFNAVSDLLKIGGIGKLTLEKVREKVTV